MSDVRRRFAEGRKPLIIAHRGDWSGSPENSPSAIRAARPFDMVEIDVRLSADGIPIVMHDPTLQRTTGHTAEIGALTAAEITALPLLNSTETVPSLDAALAAGGPDLLFDLDVKEPAELEAVADFISARPDKQRLLLKYDVKSPDDIDTLLALEQRAGTCLFAKHIASSPASVDLCKDLRDADVAAVELWFPDLETLKRCARVGPPITTYTLNEVHCAGLSDRTAMSDPAGVWGKLVGTGVAGIMTDAPSCLRTFLHKEAA